MPRDFELRPRHRVRTTPIGPTLVPWLGPAYESSLCAPTRAPGKATAGSDGAGSHRAVVEEYA